MTFTAVVVVAIGHEPLPLYRAWPESLGGVLDNLIPKAALGRWGAGEVGGEVPLMTLVS